MTTNYDQVLRFIFDKSDIRGEITTLSDSYQTAISHQNLTPEIKILLGEFLAAAVLMSRILKFEGTLTIQARGDGPLSLVMADVSNTGEVRCVAHTNSDINSVETIGSDLPSLIGKGVLTIIIDPEKGERYQGIVPLDHKTLAKCLTHYFESSEQLPTRLWLHSNGEVCGGLFLQCLPAQEVRDSQTRSDQWETALQLANTATENELFNIPHTELLYRIFNEFNCRVFSPEQLKFSCRCSSQKGENAVLSLGEIEARELVLEQDAISINCQFCGQKYIYGDKDLDKIFKRSSFH